MPTCELVIDDVSYRYRGGHQAISNLSLRLGPGIVGLLGPNGAGKSTLMHILATLSKPTQGQVRFNGEDIARNPDALRAVLGYLPQDFGVYPSLSAREFLGFLAAVKGLTGTHARERIQICLELVGLETVAERPLGSYSGGMRQRVGIAQALLNDPAVLIVDEPTVGLDPEERMRFRHVLTDLAGERLILLSTHIVSDVEASATELAIISHGKLRFNDSPEALLAAAHGQIWEWTTSSQGLAALRKQFLVCASLRRPDGVRIRVVSPHAPDTCAQPVLPNLEDAYTWLLGREAEGS